MAQPAPHGPAVIRMEDVGFKRRRKPLRHAAHLPGIGIENIQPARDLRGDIWREQFGNLDHILERFAALQALGHPRQQLADRPVRIALLFQPLPRQPVLAKDTNGLGHIANFINLGKLRRLNRIILRCQPLHHVAQANDGIEHPPLKNKPQHKQEHQRGEPNHDLRKRTPDP